MVVRRNNDNSKIDSHSENVEDSDDSDLDYLIDSLLGDVSLDSNSSRRMTIKNRKERSKHERVERSSNAESSASSSQGNPFGVRRNRPCTHTQSSPRHRTRSARNVSNLVIRAGQFHRPQFTNTESLRSQPSSNRNWTDVHEDEQKLRDLKDDIPIPETGNNSEDEYCENFSANQKSEDNGLEQLLKEKKGWRIVRVHGDGACLFRSVCKFIGSKSNKDLLAHQVFGEEDKHETVRSQVVEYMSKNREHFSQYVTEDFDHYLQRKRQPACFGNHIEIQAISELYNRPVEIYYNNVVPLNVFHAEYSHEMPIRLAYYGRTHYNSIIDPSRPMFGHGLGLPNYQPGLPEKDLVKQAIRESEASELEEAMLRDKLAESDTKDLEECITGHVLRESYLEHLKTQATDRPRLAHFSRSKKTSSQQQNPGSSRATDIAAAVPCSSFSKPLKPSSSVPSSSLTDVAVNSSASTAVVSDPSTIDSAVLKYIPTNMLDMNEDDVLAMVLEQSRSEYIESLRAVYKRDEDDDGFEELGCSATRSFFRQNLESPKSEEEAQSNPSKTASPFEPDNPSTSRTDSSL